MAQERNVNATGRMHDGERERFIVAQVRLLLPVEVAQVESSMIPLAAVAVVVLVFVVVQQRPMVFVVRQVRQQVWLVARHLCCLFRRRLVVPVALHDND